MGIVVDFLPWLAARIRRPRSGPFGRILAWVWRAPPVRHPRLLPAPARVLLSLPPPKATLPPALLMLPKPEL